ncbi:MAG: sigma-70 family RNA polymerase sigma factor [Planctomycetota bacterium]
MRAPIELLLAESAWLRRLMRRLAGDDDGAAELQQDVAVAALRAPGCAIGPAWLVSVARRLSALRRRRAVREAARIAGLVPRDAAPGAAEVVAETELQRRAVDAVLALPSHYRDVILLRFLRGMPIDAVARQLGVGIDTVRTRQKRALRQLRAQLLPEQDLGARLGAPFAGIVMGMSKKSVAAAALAVAVLWSSLFLMEGEGPVTAPVPASAVAAVAALQGARASAMSTTAVAPPSEERQLLPSAPLQPAPPTPPRRAPVPTGGILVTVVSVDGQPAGEGHAVLCRAAAGPGQVLASDGTSTVRFPDLPAGRYVVGTASATNRQAVDVLADSTTTVTMRLGAGKRVAGRVIDAQGRPVPFAEIRTQHGSTWPAWQFPIGRADAAGRFEVGGVTPMQMLLATDARLGVTPGRLLREAELQQQPHAVVELKFSNGDGSEVRGRVVDDSGVPVPRAWVQLDPYAVPALEGHIRGSASTRLCTTDAEGRFVATGIPVGRCRLYAYTPGLAPHTRYLRLSAGEPLDVEVVLPHGATVRGVVRDELGQPIADAYVRVEGQYYPQKFYVQTDAAGTFVFDDVAIGTFRVAAWQRQTPRIRREVVIDRPGEHEIEIVLTNEGSLHGRLLDARGQPLANWFVRRRGSSRWTATDADGRFTCVECKPTGNELFVRPKEQQLVHARFENLQPGPDEQVLVVGDERRPTSRVSGLVLDTGGQGLAGAQLQLEQFGALWSLPTQTGADGAFELGPLPPGSYRLKVRRDGHKLPTVDFELLPHQHLRIEPVYELR